MQTQKPIEGALCPCPLCGSFEGQIFFNQPERRYLQCDNCQLIYVHPDDRLSVAEERDRYKLHKNKIEDQAYLNFLKKLWLPLHQVLGLEQRLGLDFGCGPVEAFRKIAGQISPEFSVLPYDPGFFPNRDILQKNKFDFILASEVFEHLYQPGQVISELVLWLKPNGWLAVMTGELEDWSQFSRWHYPRDPTHVCFYPRQTREFIAKSFGLRLISPAPSVSLFQKPSSK